MATARLSKTLAERRAMFRQIRYTMAELTKAMLAHPESVKITMRRDAIPYGFDGMFEIRKAAEFLDVSITGIKSPRTKQPKKSPGTRMRV